MLMLRSRQTLAVIFSLVLVFGALWVRYADAKDAKQLETALIAEENRRQEESASFAKELSMGGEEVPSENQTPLTQTDLIGRQLFSDYMSLSSKGQATPENLDNLAAKYVDSIQKTDTAKKITLVDLKIVDDSDANLKSYGQTIFGIRSKYQNLIKQKTSGIVTLQPGTPQFSSFMKDITSLYLSSATEVENSPVPASFSVNHLKLVNNYLSSSNAASQLVDISKDPMGAYAAINIQAKNAQEEIDILNSIQSALTSKGIFFENNS